MVGAQGDERDDELGRVADDRFASSSVASPISPAAGMSEIAAVTNSQSVVLSVRSRYQLIGAAIRRTLSQLPVKAWRSCVMVDTAGLSPIESRQRAVQLTRIWIGDEIDVRAEAGSRSRKRSPTTAI